MEKKKTFILLGDVLSAQLSELLIDNKRPLGKSVRTKYYNSLIALYISGTGCEDLKRSRYLSNVTALPAAARS